MVYRTTSKVAERKAAHRARILSTAIQMFGSQGFHLTTVPMIVSESKSSTGSFYFYFHNKEDIFAAALEAIGQRVADAINDAIRSAGPDTLAQMRSAIERLVTYMSEHPQEARILIIESSGLTERLQAQRRAIIDSHARSVEQAISSLRGLPSGIEPGIAARCWVGAVLEGLHHWLESSGLKKDSAAQLARAIADYNIGGLGLHRGKRQRA